MYWDRATVKIDEIHFHPIGDHATEERTFRSGKLHVTSTIPIDRIAHYRDNQPDLLRLDPYLGTYYYIFNVQRKPLDDPRVRRALSMAIDRATIVERVTKAGEEPAYHFTPPGTAGYQTDARIFDDLEEARKLLADAGYPAGEGFPSLKLLYNTSDAHERIAQVVQQMWKKALGIEIQLENMEWKVYLDATQRGTYDIARAGWIGDYVDPNSFLDMWVTGGGNNRANWSNADYDRLIREASTTLDPTQRFKTFSEAETILMKESPIMPIYSYRSKSLVDPSVQGWNPTILDHHPYKHLDLK
jgi:oligopeptide transport system substrate-binding protein